MANNIRFEEIQKTEGLIKRVNAEK